MLLITQLRDLRHVAQVYAVIDENAADGLARSFLADVDPVLLEAIRRRAVMHHHRSGDMVVSENERHWTGIVLGGMARVFLTTKGGRQVTLRHARAGSSIGVGALLGEGRVSAQAVTNSRS